MNTIIGSFISQILGLAVVNLIGIGSRTVVTPAIDSSRSLVNGTTSVVIGNTLTNPLALYRLVKEGCIGLGHGIHRALNIWGHGNHPINQVVNQAMEHPLTDIQPELLDTTVLPIAIQHSTDNGGGYYPSHKFY